MHKSNQMKTRQVKSGSVLFEDQAVTCNNKMQYAYWMHMHTNRWSVTNQDETLLGNRIKDPYCKLCLAN